MARSLGSPALLIAVWSGMALMTLAGALCFTELAVRNPQDGGEYVYLRRGFGRQVAFLYGWMAAVVMYPGVAAALCVGAVPYFAALWAMPRWMASMLPALILLVLGAMNYFGTRLSSGVMATLNWLKVPVLLTLVGWALLSGHATLANLAPLAERRAGSDPLMGAIAGAAISAFFCFGGWWEAGKIAGQVRNPSRTLPLAFSGGVLVVTALYMLVSLAFVAVVPMERIQSNTAFVAQFGQALFGTAGSRVLSSCVVLSVLGGLMVLSMAVPRVTYALAQGEMSAEERPWLLFRPGAAASTVRIRRPTRFCSRPGWRCWFSAWGRSTTSWHSSSFPPLFSLPSRWERCFARGRRFAAGGIRWLRCCLLPAAGCWH